MCCSAVASRPLALVTGASEGVGYALCRQLGRHGYDLIAVAGTPRVARLRALSRCGVQVETLKLDLTRADGVDELYGHVHAGQRRVDTLALTATGGPRGTFAASEPAAATPLTDELEIIDRDVRCMVHLTKHVVTDMLARGSGHVLFASAPGPRTAGSRAAVGDASWSFMRSFAVDLRDELDGTGVDVTVLTPGDARFGGSSDGDRASDLARRGLLALRDRGARPAASPLATVTEIGGAGRTPRGATFSNVPEPGSAADF